MPTPEKGFAKLKSEHAAEIAQLEAERDFLATIVEAHEARLRTFAADLQLVLLNSVLYGDDDAQAAELSWAKKRLFDLIAPVISGYVK
jgi:hypothetical protein